MGWVGSSLAISILNSGFCRELLVNDIRPGIAEGEAMDLNHGASFFPTARVEAVALAEMKTCKAIVVTAGRGGKPGETRLDLLRENLAIAKEIARELKDFRGLLIVVSNPVDVLTYFYEQYTDLPPGHVIGTGTFLDTVRLRQKVGVKLQLDPRNVHAQVVGEHGDSEVILWSSATIGGIALRKWAGWSPALEAKLGESVRTAAQEIIRRKGATNHAIGLVTATLLRWLLRGERRIVSLSVPLAPEQGLGEVALSLPCLLSAQGVESILPLSANAAERRALEKSAAVLRRAIAGV